MTAIAIPELAAGPWRAELRATLALAWPLVLTQLAQISLGTTDVLFIGRLGADALAAGALGVSLFFLLVVCGWGIILATGPMMAQAIGARRHAVREVRRCVRQGLWAAVAITALAWPAMHESGAVLRLLGQAPAAAAAAEEYVRAMAWGLLPALWFMALRQFTAALERPLSALAVQLGVVAVNALGNWALVFGEFGFPALGLRGSGIASAAASWAGLVALLAFVSLDRRMRRYRLLGRFWRPDWQRFLQVWRLGLPIAATLLFEVGVFSGAVYVMGLLGTAELAAHQIAIQCAATTFMVPLGVAQAATMRVGLAAGAGDRAGVHRAGWMAFALGVGFMTAMAAAISLGRWPLVGAFLDLGRPENLRAATLAAEFLLVAGLFQLFDGAQVVALGALRGLGDTRVPMLIAAFGYWAVAFPAGVALGFAGGLGGLGIWLGLALGLAVVAVLLTRRFAVRERLGLGPAPA